MAHSASKHHNNSRLISLSIARIVLAILLIQAEIAFARPIFSSKYMRHRTQGINHSLNHAEANAQRRSRAKIQEKSSEYDQQNEVINDDEDDDDQIDQGPWKIPIPTAYQSFGYGLRLRGRQVPLNGTSITLTGRDSPEFVTLQDPYGRALDRHKIVVNQHVFTGFKPRSYRISGWWGVSRLLGKSIASGTLPSTVAQVGAEGIYQPGPLGFSIGVDSQNAKFTSRASSISQNLAFRSTDLRVGGVFEWGLFPKSSNYRWHSIAHGGLLLGTISLTPESGENLQLDRNTDATQSTSLNRPQNASAISKGIYGAWDIVHMWQNWWWGGKFMMTHKYLDSTAENFGGSMTSIGLEIIGSYTF